MLSDASEVQSLYGDRWPSGAAPEELCCRDVYQEEISKSFRERQFHDEYILVAQRILRSYPDVATHNSLRQSPPWAVAKALKVDFATFDFLVEAFRGKTPVSKYLLKSKQTEEGTCLVCRSQEEDLEHFFLACRLSQNVFFVWNNFFRTFFQASLSDLSLSHRGILLPPCPVRRKVMIYLAGSWTLWRLLFKIQRRWVREPVSQYPPADFWVRSQTALGSLFSRWGCTQAVIDALATDFTTSRWLTVRRGIEF